MGTGGRREHRTQPQWLQGFAEHVNAARVGGRLYLGVGFPGDERHGRQRPDRLPDAIGDIQSLDQVLTWGIGQLVGSVMTLLGVVLGLMMCFDLGGPVNKAAYLFATAGLAAQSTASFQIMAAVMAAGMVPPIALALATTVRPKLFTEPELENGRAAWLLGASFISEGAIPFAAADPLRVIPSMMAGGAVTGGGGGGAVVFDASKNA